MSYTFDIVDGSWIPVVFIGVICILFVAWIITLIEIVNHEYTANNKIVWLGLVVLLPFIGMVLYYCFGRREIIGKTARLNKYTHSKDEFV